MSGKMRQLVWGAWEEDRGFDLGSFGPTKRSVIAYMVAVERQWLLDEEDYTDSQIWRKSREYGWRVIRASIARC